MKQYYYLKGPEKVGPMTADELLSSDVNGRTLVWTEGDEDWTTLYNNDELYEKYKSKIPPKTPLHILEARERHFRIHKNAFNLAIGWTLFHSFALLMSYCEIKVFNPEGSFSTKDFWPFVDFYRWEDTGFRTRIREDFYSVERSQVFNGIFVNYDLTEFVFYISAGLILFFLFKKWTKS